MTAARALRLAHDRTGTGTASGRFSVPGPAGVLGRAAAEEQQRAAESGRERPGWGRKVSARDVLIQSADECADRTVSPEAALQCVVRDAGRSAAVTSQGKIAAGQDE